MTTSAAVKFDEGTRLNPSPAAIRYIVETDGLTEEESEHIGELTNNLTVGLHPHIYKRLIGG